MMESSKTRTTSSRNKTNHFLSLLSILKLCAFLLLPISLAEAQKDDDEAVIGYGYKLQSVHSHNNSGKLLTADLQLIKNTSTYGPDIQHLTLTARSTPLSLSLILFIFYYAKSRNLDSSTHRMFRLVV